MKPGNRRYTVEFHSSGQQRSYGPSVYRFTISVEWIAYRKRENNEPLTWEPNDLNEHLIVKAAQALGHGWLEEGDGDWASPRLTYQHKEGPGKWTFTVEEAFTD